MFTWWLFLHSIHLMGCQFSRPIFKTENCFCVEMCQWHCSTICIYRSSAENCKVSQVIHCYSVHQLDASSYTEYRHQLDSKVLLSEDLHVNSLWLNTFITQTENASLSVTTNIIWHYRGICATVVRRQIVKTYLQTLKLNSFNLRCL